MHCKFAVFIVNSLCLFYLFILAYLLLLDIRHIFSRVEILYIISLRPLPPETAFRDFRHSIVMERNEETEYCQRSFTNSNHFSHQDFYNREKDKMINLELLVSFKMFCINLS